ncbi:MAG TPA: cardiolipin synthase ClsB [Rhodocyclaceae bacterium]
MKQKFLTGNRVDLLECGREYFPALLEAINGAQKEVHLESYIFEPDETGRGIAAALAAAARRGVAVRVLVDGFGARDFAGGLGRMLQENGVEVLVYRAEVASLRMRRNRLRRLHRKVVVVDASIAFVGGINVIDDMDTPHQTPPRYDYAVRVSGPLLADIHGAARHLWQLVRWAELRHRYRVPLDLLPDVAPKGDTIAAFVIRDNIGHRRDIEEAYLEAIASARREMVIASAYFLPGWRFRRALADAVERGVVVTVLLQGRVEYLLLHYATQALYGALLKSGVHILEYRRSFLHAKVAVADETWATVGSSNIDPFSLLLAREANVVVYDPGFARRLRDSLRRAMTDGATEVKAEDVLKRPLAMRLACWFAYGLVRLLIGFSRYGGNDYRE